MSATHDLQGRSWETQSPEGRPVQRPPRTRVFLPALLFFLTVLTTLVCGMEQHLSFRYLSGALPENPWEQISWEWGLLWNGAPFAAAVLLILLAHEMGHYLACRFYGIRATLPYILPAPPLINPFGTFGAVIRIKSPFWNRKQLFDVGIAGPLAGFVFIVPALWLGITWSTELQIMPQFVLEFGEPLLFVWMSKWVLGSEITQIALHPIGFAAWFGIFATSLNLLPIGQLDGGHVVYALFGARTHRIVSWATFLALVAVSFISWPPFLLYPIFGLLALLLGRRHPPTLDDSPGLGRGRIMLALVGVLIQIGCFMTVPLKVVFN